MEEEISVKTIPNKIPTNQEVVIMHLKKRLLEQENILDKINTKIRELELEQTINKMPYAYKNEIQILKKLLE